MTLVNQFIKLLQETPHTRLNTAHAKQRKRSDNIAIAHISALWNSARARDETCVQSHPHHQNMWRPVCPLIEYDNSSQLIYLFILLIYHLFVEYVNRYYNTTNLQFTIQPYRCKNFLKEFNLT
jgi:hypothetical protein